MAAGRTGVPSRATWLTWLLVLIGLIGPALATAAEPGFSLVARPPGATPEQVAPELPDGPATLPPDAALALPAAPGMRHWISLALPAAGLDGDRPAAVLWMERVPLDVITLHQETASGWMSESIRAFEREADAVPGLSHSGFAFRIVPSAISSRVLLEVETAAAVRLYPRVLDQNAFDALERRNAMIAAALFTGLLLLAVNAGMMYFALRESSYRRYLWFVVALAALLAALTGLLYRLPGLSLFSQAGANGILALGHLLVAALFSLLRDFACLDQRARRCDRILHWMPWVFLAAAGACVAGPERLTGLLQNLSAALWIAAALLMAIMASVAVRHRRPMAKLLLPVWLTIAVAGGARALWGLGFLPQGAYLNHGFQIALTVATFVISMALTGRVIEFRRQGDSVREEKARTDADLQLEKARRQFSDTLQLSLRSALPGDLEWVAFRRLLDALKPLIRQTGSAVYSHGHHGRDVLLSEPLSLKLEYAALFKDRGGSIRNLARARQPVQVSLATGANDGEHSGLFAVVPLPVVKPSWGVILIEREPLAEFSQEELSLIVAFAKIACAAIEETGRSLELERKAEVDPLTGALNRRALEARLAMELMRAEREAQPLSLLFMDVDRFKQINDQFGHGFGDECLRILARVVRREAGVDCVFGRYGGEEFVVVLPELHADRARPIAERIREALSQESCLANGVPVAMSVSIGVAARHAGETDGNALLERADKALYAAKKAGRNRVHMAPSHAAFVGADAPPRFL
jgi:diguanylate cyclase (GGDEF)-like protein